MKMDNPYVHDNAMFHAKECGGRCPACAFEAGRAYDREQAANRDAEQAREGAYFDKLKEG